MYELTKTDQLPTFRELLSVFEKVFEMKDFSMPPDAHLQRLLEKDSFIVVVAKHGDRVVGGLTAYVLDQYYAQRPLTYIYDLAVLQEYQRKGIGGQLISFINAYCREKGYEEVFVQADKVDDYALDFYRSTNPTAEEEVVHFYYTL